MNYSLFFFIFSGIFLILSVITICIAPLINRADGDLNYFNNWNLENCQLLDDQYQHEKDNNMYDPDVPVDVIREKLRKRRITECRNHKAMYGLEYTSFIADIVLGFICFILGIIDFLEPQNHLVKISCLIGFILGIISTILTLIYVGFSAYIFNNETIQTKGLLYSNKAFLHWNGEKYIYNYDEKKYIDEDYDIKLVKYKDLGRKQYNYDSEIYRLSQDTTNNNEYKNCFFQFSSIIINQQKPYASDSSKNCEFIWYQINPNSPLSADIFAPSNDSVQNKFLYDRWLTTIIFGVIIAACGICMAVFGFLLFIKSGDSTSSPKLISNIA